MSESKLRPVHQSLYPTLPSLDNCLEYLSSQLPIHQTNQLKSALMAYHNTLLRQIEFKSNEHVTVGELARTKYPNQTYDIALPQDWVNRMQERGFDPRGHFVTLYPKDSGPFPYMAPITEAGVRMAAMVASMEA